MQNDIYLIGQVGVEITLDNAIKQVNQTDQSKPLNVHIHSVGGSVYEGLAIYNYFKSLPQRVNTISSGLVASSASIIFLAGNKATRKINSSDNFLIHLPSGKSDGNAKDLEKTAKELREIENKLATIYEKETDITKEEALELMQKDEMLDVDFLKEKGFVSEIVDFKAIAHFNDKPKEKIENKMKGEYSKEEQGVIAKFLKNLGFGKVPDPKNVMINTLEGSKLDFSEVEEDQQPQIGDTAVLINMEGEESTIQIQNKDMYVFEDGKLTDIKKFIEEQEAEDMENKTLSEDQISAIIEKVAEKVSNSFTDVLKQRDQKIESLTASLKKREGILNRLESAVSNITVDPKENKKESNVKPKKKSFADSMINYKKN